MHKLFLLATAALIMPIAACTSDISTSHYSTSSVGSVAQTMGGTVVSVRRVTVSSEDNNAGTLIGGALGGWLFSLFDLPVNSWMGELIVAVIGAMVFLWVWNQLLK